MLILYIKKKKLIHIQVEMDTNTMKINKKKGDHLELQYKKRQIELFVFHRKIQKNLLNQAMKICILTIRIFIKY